MKASSEATWMKTTRKGVSIPHAAHTPPAPFTSTVPTKFDQMIRHDLLVGEQWRAYFLDAQLLPDCMDTGCHKDIATAAAWEIHVDCPRDHLYNLSSNTA
jgi:hypothetical protein